MNQTQSPCPPTGENQTQNKKWRTGLVFVAFFLSLSIIGLWVFAMRSQSQVVAIMGASYALLCTAFLGAQMVAFVKAHLDYDQTIEKPKFDVIRLELEEWND